MFAAVAAACPPLGGELSCAALADALLRRVDGEIEQTTADGLPYLIGNLWTARQRQAHRLHEISYRACFKPQLPALLIDLLTAEGDVVLDPFLGRGTTAIQAALMNRVAYGSDANPLSVILTAPRLAPPPLDAIAERLRQIPARAAIPDSDRRLTVFYHPQVLAQLVALKEWLLQRERGGALDAADGWIRMVATNRLTGHSPGFFSVRTMPPNQAVSVESQRAINAKHGQTPPPKDVPALILKKSRQLLGGDGAPVNAAHRLACADAAALSHVGDGEARLMVTSPPFLDMVNYAHDNWLRCWFNGVSLDEVDIASHRSVEDWTAFVARCFAEFARVIAPGGFAAFEVGEARRGTVLLEQAVARAVQGLPFSLVAVLVNRQRFTKTANCWGVANNTGGTNTNRIVLLQRV